jgi:hypothetical protein
MSQDCELHHDVCPMTLDEQDKFIQNIMAHKDTEMAAIAGSMTQTETSKGRVVEREVNELDVVRSSG